MKIKNRVTVTRNDGVQESFEGGEDMTITHVGDWGHVVNRCHVLPDIIHASFYKPIGMVVENVKQNPEKP